MYKFCREENGSTRTHAGSAEKKKIVPGYMQVSAEKKTIVPVHMYTFCREEKEYQDTCASSTQKEGHMQVLQRRKRYSTRTHTGSAEKKKIAPARTHVQVLQKKKKDRTRTHL